MRPIHNHMPAIIPKDQEDRWLDSDLDDPSPLLELLRPYPAEQMETREVSTLVNSPVNDSPECLAPANLAGSASSIYPMLPFSD